MIRLVLAALLLAAAPVAGAAQQQTQHVDRIVAVVGTKPILASQLEEELVQQQAQGRQLPTDTVALARLKREVLNQMIEVELLVQQAQRDTSIKITEQEVLDQVEQSYQNVRKQFNSEAEFRDQLRLARFGTVEEWRRWLADEQRRALYSRRLIEAQQQKGKLRPIPPTDEQMRQFWEENRAQQPRRPATISFRQLIIKPVPDSGSRARALQRAESLLVEMRHGGDFSAAAKRFSSDSVSAAQGGELGWFRRGVMVKEFEDVAFRLRPGEISNIVETPFGFHIIKLERTQPAEILARHILISPEITPAQVEKARLRADSVRSALASGASFDSLARLYSDPNEAKLAEDTPVDQLPAEYRQLVSSDTALGLKPVVLAGEGGPVARQKFAIIDIIARHGEGEVAYEDVKLRIRQILSEQLATKHYIDQLRRQTYIDIRL